MRPIKFKAFDKNKNIIVNVDSIEFVDAIEGRTGINVFVEGKRNSYWLDAFKDEYELIQFNGIIDDNGQEIYEDDIVQYTRLRTMMDGFITTTIRMPKLTEYTEYSVLILHRKGMVKIGNYHSNPELLNKK